VKSSLREAYRSYLRCHGLAPREVPENAKVLREAARKQAIEAARSSGDDFLVRGLEAAFAEEDSDPRFETRHVIDIQIEDAASEIDASISAIPSYHRAFTDNIFVGDFPTGSFNACSVMVDNGYLVLINSGLVTMLKQVAEMLWMGDPNDVTMSPDNIAVIEGISEVVAAYFKYDDSFFGPRQINYGLRSIFSQTLSKACLKFVIAHEYGHVLAGHFAKPSVTTARIPTGAGEIDVIVKNWREELEADKIAYCILLGTDKFEDVDLRVIDRALGGGDVDWGTAFKATDLKCNLVAPFIVFLLDGIVTQVESRVAKRTSFSQTHPDCNTRNRHLLPVVEGKDNKYVSFLGYVGILAAHFDRCVDAVASALVPGSAERSD
jgi:hypothetical protein